jgi:hypothetical protein
VKTRLSATRRPASDAVMLCAPPSRKLEGKERTGTEKLEGIGFKAEKVEGRRGGK